MPPVSVKCVIEGRVQGVFFRVSTVDQATSLGLSGWVRNRTDGKVELVAAGDERAVQELIAWLWQGPPQAEVEAVTVQEWSDRIEAGFRAVG